MAIVIVVVVILVVTAKTSHTASQVQARGKRNVIPFIIIAALIAMAIGGSH